MTDDLEDSLIARTQSYLKAKQTDKAKFSAQELSRMDPKDAIVWFVKAKVHYMMEEYDDALSSLAKAAQINSEQPEIWLLMGYTLIALRRYLEAKESLEYVHAMQPEDAEVSSALCVLFTILGDEQTARQYFEHSKELDKSATYKVLAHFYEEVFRPSAQLSPQMKENLEAMLSKIRI
ncbi:MAG: tetratricopeptide repeat protein [Candidatus Micrarchaeota archaeon]